MTEWTDFIHYASIASVISINSVGVGIGQGLTYAAAVAAINIQPKARDEIAKLAILGTALIETSAILGVTMAIMLLIERQQPDHLLYARIAEIGIVFAMCFSGFIIGLFSSLPAQAACFSTARQPFFSQKIMRFMLVIQSIIQTPIIFGFIIALIIKTQSLSVTTSVESIRLLASGLCIGLGSLGPAIGLSLFAETACYSLSINRNAYNKLLSFSLISQAIIETPIIFSLVVSVLLIVWNVNASNPVTGIAFLSAAMCMGIGTFGSGISSGKTAAAACKQIALKPSIHSMLSKVSMFSQGLIDTCAIYALLISLIILLIH